MKRIIKWNVLFLLVCYAIGLPLSLVSAEDETALFKSPQDCVQHFNSYLLSGNFEGMIETFAADVQVECIKYKAYEYTTKFSQSGEKVREKLFNRYGTIDQDYSVLNKGYIEGRTAHQICKMIKTMFIPSEWNIKNHLIDPTVLYVKENRVIGLSDNIQGITIDEYFDSISAEHLSQIETVAVYEVKEWNEQISERWLQSLNEEYNGNIDELQDIMVAYSYNGEIFFLGLRLVHYVNKGWAILKIGNDRLLECEPYSGDNHTLLINTWASTEKTLYEVNWELLLTNTKWFSGKDQSWIQFGSEKTVEMCLENIGDIWKGTYSCVDDQLTFSFTIDGKQREIKATIKQEQNEWAAQEGYSMIDKIIAFPGYKFQI